MSIFFIQSSPILNFKYPEEGRRAGIRNQMEKTGFLYSDLPLRFF